MKKFLLSGLGVLLLSVLILSIWLAYIVHNLPDVSVLKNYRPSAAAEVLDKDGGVLTQFYDRKFRIWAPVSGLPEVIVHAVVTAEDDTFFEHKGVNYKAVRDAIVHDVQKHRFARGGSTITQQMIKNVLLSKEKTIIRKIREYVLAQRAEELLTKRRILEIYLNEVEWGDNIYGIEAASRFYLDKHASELTVSEAALLAGMLPNPRYYNPFKRPDKAKTRQDQVLFNMQQARLITQDEYSAALQVTMRLRQEGSSRFDLSALTRKNGRPCYQHALEELLLDMFGEQELYRSGQTIKTTIDKTLQDELAAWENGLQAPELIAPDNIALIRQGAAIRAIICAAGKESVIRSKLELMGSLASGYEVYVAGRNTIVREMLIRSDDGGISN